MPPIKEEDSSPPDNGDCVDLSLRFEGLDIIDGVKARIESHFRSNDSIVMRLEFDRAQVAKKLPAELLHTLDRRRAPRVRVPQDSGVQVSVTDGTHQYATSPVVINISSHGMLLKFEMSELPRSDVDLSLNISLPQSRELLKLGARVVNRTPTALAEYWGIEFKVIDNKDTFAALSEIESYVIAHLDDATAG